MTAITWDLFDDRDLGIFDDERFESSGTAVLIGGGHGVTNDPDRRRVGDDPFGDPEFSFRLLDGAPVPHRKILGHSCIGQVNDELGRWLPFAGARMNGSTPKSERIALCEAA